MANTPTSAAAPNPLIRLHIGGKESRAGWTLMSMKPGPGVDVVGDGSDLSMFETGTVVEIYAPYVYQRFGFRAELTKALKEAFRVLIPGGVLRVSVPNLETIARLFLEPKVEYVDKFNLLTLVYGEQTSDSDFHRSAYSFELLSERLAHSGFRNIQTESFSLFSDFSSLKFGPIPLSLNAMCTKETNAIALNNEANKLHTQGLLREALSQYELALLLAPDKAFIHSNYLFVLNYQASPDMAAIFVAHKNFGDLFERGRLKPAVVGPGERASRAQGDDGDRRIRIGYVSSDFREHAVAHFIEPVLAAHNRSRFELYCYYHHTAIDETTRRIQALVPNWRSIVGKSDDEIADMVRHDQIDILVDLAGHSGLNRLAAFARKPAPVQVTWLGYPNTTGLSSMDYRITDGFADPVGLTEAYHTEKLVRLPGSFSCYRAPENCPEVGPLPALHSGHVTFGSFNIFAKITPEVIELWAKILKRVPAATLTLKYKDLDSAFMTRSIQNSFASHGIEISRLTILGDDPSHSAHMDRYNTIDIGLDPFPYNGTTTTCDALWMGVPVVTRAGCSHVSRVGVSQMSNLGLPELIGKSKDDYVEIAAGLAGDLRRLAELRAGMRARMLASPLMDIPRFTRNLESAYLQMWNSHLSGARST